MRAWLVRASHRAIFSHSASVGKRQGWCVMLASQRAYATASCQETQTTGWSRRASWVGQSAPRYPLGGSRTALARTAQAYSATMTGCWPMEKSPTGTGYWGVSLLYASLSWALALPIVNTPPGTGQIGGSTHSTPPML